MVLERNERKVVNEAIDNLEFAFGKAIIKEASYSSLDSLTALLKEHRDWRIILTGHTDSIGTKARNLALS